jgi:hypothetical protein
LTPRQTPKKLRARAFPKRIGHLFRDEDEIPASSHLSDQIKDALKRSDHLCGRHVVSALTGTAFAQEDGETAKT